MAGIPFILPMPIWSSGSSVRYANYSPRYYSGYPYSGYPYRGYPYSGYPYSSYTNGPYRRRYSRYGMDYGPSRYPTTVMLGPLPNDFLTIPPTFDPARERQRQEEMGRQDRDYALYLQTLNRTQPVVGRLQITVVRATLNKNYGMTRMDPYARLHFGQQVFETQTDANGAKNPVWNKTFYIYQLPKSYTSFHLELYDERTLTDDERIAWVTIPLPQPDAQGELHDKAYKLSGKMGDEMEGSIQITMVFESGPAPSLPGYLPTTMPIYNPHSMGSYVPQEPLYRFQAPIHPMLRQPGQQPTYLTPEEIKEVCDVFPNIEPEAVKSVLEASEYNREKAVEALLLMQSSNN